MTQIVLNVSRGRGFPRSRTGFVVKCQLVGQERVSQVASGQTPFFGDVFSWEMTAALLKKLLDSAPAVKLHVYHFDSLTAFGPTEPLGHVLLHLKTVWSCQILRACVRYILSSAGSRSLFLVADAISASGSDLVHAAPKRRQRDARCLQLTESLPAPGALRAAADP